MRGTDERRGELFSYWSLRSGSCDEELQREGRPAVDKSSENQDRQKVELCQRPGKPEAIPTNPPSGSSRAVEIKLFFDFMRLDCVLRAGFGARSEPEMCRRRGLCSECFFSNTLLKTAFRAVQTA
jgi:hypothetical protein